MAIFPALCVALGALIVDSVIELAFISTMVAWLHTTASGSFIINYNNSTFNLRGMPVNILLDQGHTSNGAAGTALILVGFGGILTLWLRSRPSIIGTRLTNSIYYVWLVLAILSLMLTLGALAYVFAVTNAHSGQIINVTTASTLGNQKYPVDVWTPQNWFTAFIKLDLADASQRSTITSNLHIMRGWQYNLIPLFIIQLFTTILVVLDYLQRRKTRPNKAEHGSVKQHPSV